MKPFFKHYPTTTEGKLFLLFLASHFLVWSLVPLLRQSLPMDSVEAIVWGQICTFGTNKHPPLSGFPAAFLFWLTDGKAISIYLLSQLCILAGFIYIFRLAKLFLPVAQSCLCVILMEGIIYYGFTAAEYNVNVLSLALWPISAFYFYRATHDKGNINWLLFGLFTGLNLLNKYTGGVLIVGMGFYLLFSKNGRKSFKNKGFYLSIITALIIIAPHIIWLYQNDFFTLGYVSHRINGNETAPFINHLWYPVKFILAQVLAGVATLVIYMFAYCKNRHSNNTPAKVPTDAKTFIFCLGALPLLTFAIISLIGGIPLKSMWGTPLLYMLTIGLFTFLPFSLGKLTFKRLSIAAFIIMALFSGATAVISTIAGGEKQLFNAPEFASAIHQTFGADTPLHYVGGDIWYSANFSLYDSAHPKAILDIQSPYHPCLNYADFTDKGALVISDDKSLYSALQTAHKTGALNTYELKIKTVFGKKKKKDIYYFLIKPVKDK